MAVRFKLRLLTGALYGRELMLPEGEFTLGEQGCDVLLPVTEGHTITLSIREHEIKIQADGDVRINGSKHNLQEPLPLLEPIDIAGLTFVLGTRPDILSGIKVTQRAGRPLFFWLSLVVCVPLSLLFVIIFWLTTQPDMLQTYALTDVPTQLAKRLSEPGLQGIKEDWQADGSVILSGYCTSSAIIEPLQHFLLQNRVASHNQLICDDRLITAVINLLHQHGYQDVEVRAGKASGDVVIYGAIQMGEQWLKVQNALATLSGLKNWQVVNVHEGQSQQLIERIRIEGLLGQLSMAENNKEITISGMLSAEKQRQLKTMLDAYSQEKPDFLPVKYQNIPPLDRSKELLSAEIVGYGGNQHAEFVRLANGQRLQQGGLLSNGYKVVFIGEQGIALLKENDLIHIPINF